MKLKPIEEEWEEEIDKPWQGPIAKRSKTLNRHLENLKYSKVQARVKEIKWRLTQEITIKSEKKSFVIFNTLTVEPKYYKTIWAKESKAWQEYISQWTRLIHSPIF